MFSCLWQLWDWFDPTSMENKKGLYHNTAVTPSNEITPNEAIPKHSHQHNTASQHLRLLQYGLKIPNHQHQVNQTHPHQQLNSPLHFHMHQQYPQATHRHLQPSPQQINSTNYLPNYVHQHQQTNNTQYQSNQPPPLHPHTQITQPSSQIWVPHQPPVHYHQQNKAEAQKKTTVQPQVKKEPVPVERKKSSNSSQLRSPSAKRPVEAPVTMQGWLHKQGSEGLMLWKKRWFVLSEYCLFYYKSPEEEKLLGSILLPSYKVSICGPEDKVNRKYAFKCEHANMRTYILAADSQELMMQWIRVLNLACLLQSNVETESAPPVPSMYQSKNSDHQESNTPVHMHSSSNTTDLSNPSQQELSQYNQPLYANAPPKPRRLNDGSYSSPSPDVLERYNPHMMRNIPKSPVNIYGHVHMNSQSPQPEYIHHRPKHMEYVYTPTRELQNIPQNMERRTPDTYGRSKLHPAKSRHPTDYEDVYADQTMYKRPLSPIAYSHVRKSNPVVNPAYRSYTPVHMLGPKDMVQYSVPQMRKSPTITRPHSADFLEYELNHRHPNPSVLTRQQPRPKSSLDINRNSNDSDNYFYSEERYAEKMRKSAQYLPKMPKYYTTSADPMHQRRVASKYPENENNFALMRSNTQPIDFNTLQVSEMQPVRSRSVLSEGSLSKELDTAREAVSPSFARQDPYNYDDMRNRDYDQFTRSASARLTQNGLQGDGKPMTMEGDRKREESMKRLLEWKQRMLQSPLNRKAQNQRVYSGRPEYYCKNQENEYMSKNQANVYPDGRRSVNNLPQYNSYSSDDEENEEGSKENVQSQAGRTLDTFPNNSESLTPVHTTSITVFNTLKEPDKPLTQSDTMHDISHFTNNEVEEVKENDACEESTFTKPLVQCNKESSHRAHVSSLRSEYSDKFEPSPVVTEIKSNGALVKSILAEFGKKINSPEKAENPPTPTKEIPEENYMTMTPKKNILEPRNSDSTVIFNECEENPYVEMTHNIDISFLESNYNPEFTDQQPYEMVCISEGKFEPVYMELKNPDKNTKSKLPDIIVPRSKMTCNKSDSSDADDEASKDLDSLDTPSNPRFSLSDNFRPASYYLGASQTVAELQDSSDSELVSPPPIPTSPPPLEDLDNTDDSILTNQKVELDKKQNLSAICVLKDQDSASVCSINTEADRRLNSRLSQNSDSDVELRMSLSRNVDYERMLKRRPVSEEFCDELDSMNGNFDDSVDLDKYLTDLHLKDDTVLNDSKKFHEYENFYIARYREKLDKKSETNIETNDLSSDDYQKRAESRASTSAEICGFLQGSNRSTPSLRISSSLSVQEMPTISSYFSDRRDISSNSSFNQPAPYYYSDLSMNVSNTDSTSTILTLNNQRGTMNGSKRDITRIINPIKCNSHLREAHSSTNIIDNTFKLAAEARSASVDFLNLTDKSGHIDKKNIYESDTLKRLKVSEMGNTQSDPETRNLYPSRKIDKFNSLEMTNNETNVRRSHSLEGLLENVFSESGDQADSTFIIENNTSDNIAEGSYLWEEDSIWRERLRSASQRHTKSMDDLDSIGESKKVQKKSPRGITRGVTYVNDNVYNMPKKEDSKTEEGGGIRKEGSFIIDREKLRQWDLLSSAPSDDQMTASQGPRGSNTVLEIGDGSEPVDFNTQQAASGSISINTRDTFPKAISSKRIWTPNSQTMQSRSVTNLARAGEHENYMPHQQGYYLNQGPNHHDVCMENPHYHKENWSLNDKMNVSAGELLGRTHEELVLLLIQLRRQSSNTLQAIENAYNEIDTIQAQLHGSLLNQAKRLENLQKLEQIKQHLIELEKQYEKGKPLVNLVDNMVKLGSLYRSPNERNLLAPHVRDRLEFNQQIQERRLLADERRDWNRLNLNHLQLQEKVQQLYQLDKLIQEESGTLQNLQQDKEDIERALGGLKNRLNKGFSDPAEIEEAKKQQVNLENELSRVHLMLAQNSKKLEETVAGNARLEQELLILKQKLQISRQQRSSPQFSNAGDSLPCAMGTSAMLESDLQRVQQKVGDLQKQRQELSLQVRQLTDRSNSLQQQIKHSPAVTQNEGNKKKVNSFWRETDLDTMNSVDHGDSWDNHQSNDIYVTPLYINTDIKHSEADLYNRSLKSSDSTSDDTIQNSNLASYEKQEIKTVRIVKRESERRQRDREKSTTGKWDALVEEDTSSQNSSILFRPTPIQKTQSSTNVMSPTLETDKSSGILSRQSSLSSPSLPQVYSDGVASSGVEDSIEKSPELSPIFKSEAARQIITEMSIQDTPKLTKRRAIPKEKRRHYTAPHNNLIMKSLNQLPTDDNAFDKMIGNDRRARDDLDMERALRQRIDTPDVVRSTLSSKELKYNESTIDNILGTPNKISIPERYIPEQLPQLSAEEQEHRLRKVESIKKMLSDAAIISSSSSNLASDEKKFNKTPNNITNKATSKMIEEKKQREHLLQLNQILAKQVMEMSKIVAGTNNPDEQ
ncbi:uncharacterized protein LOC123006857 isoform X3 [Tribolium madens]|uniref:uncharacterized protein LOC123006857 isoform X3 n=1 Tax=Tribolium madens TaxID=41895 RepID=UPI001CF75187|nr:uncharacterized protein LOC123006857 isoform X3 [Tribolium madens]